MAENSSCPTVNRIFIGGLGANVTSNDLKNIFTSLGKVTNVEFVRTNGRDFAYVDFEPESDKSLQKLFSIYNGCKWKGGKLRLERAKEHYLTRLKREWAEDSVPVQVPEPEPVPVPAVPTNPKSEKFHLDSMKINIFFPKLNKIKTLPYKGSGKHKYSFQRVELLNSLPLHFCDCEEHCGPHTSVNQIYTSALDSAAREREMSIMHSVMDKLMKENEERENEQREDDERENEEREDDERGEIEEGEESDGDIVLNISSGKSDELMLEHVLKESLDDKKISQERKQKASKEKLVDKQAQETYKSTQNENEEKERVEEESDGDLVINISSNKSDGLTLERMLKDTLDNKNELQEKRNDLSKEKKIQKQAQEASFNVDKTEDNEKSSPINVEKESNSLTGKKENETKIQKHNSNNTWFQKSAWRNLVGDSSTNLFSSSTSTTRVTQQTLISNLPKQANNSNVASNKRNESQVTQPSLSSIIPKQGNSLSEESKKRKEITKDGGAVNKEVRRVKVKVGEVCPFMRNEESEKEWNKTKKALSGYMKSKSDGSNKMRGKRGE